MCKAKENRTAALRMLENSYHGKEVPRQSCGVSLGAKNKELGTKLGVTVTPTIAFKNGRVFMGARSKEDIRNMLNGTPEGK
jgi:protein-disulfide isomerase